MKINNYFFTFLRVGIGFIFALSGFQKLMQPYQNFMSQILMYDLVKTDLAAILAMVLPWVEFFMGVFLILGLWTRLDLMVASTMNAVFIFALASVLLRKIKMDDCGCFGGLKLAPWQTLTLDFVLFIAIGISSYFIEKTKTLGLDRLFESKK